MAELAVAAAAGTAKMVGAWKKKKAYERQAAEYREAKNRRMGAATREMSEERRKQSYIQSRAIAVAAASGAGTDAGMVNLLADLAAEGEYRVMSVLWAGQNDAEGLIAQAEASQQAADDALIVGFADAITTAFSTYQAAGGTFGGTKTTTTPPTAGSGGIYAPTAEQYFGGSFGQASSYPGLFSGSP